MPTIRHLLLLLPLAAAAACSDDNLGNASFQNVVDTVTIFSLTGTPISSPSGFFMSTGGAGAIRTDQASGSAFEFVYNLQADGQKVLLPRAVLGITSTTAEPGLQNRSETFDEIKVASSNGYITDQSVPIEVGQRLMIRSRVICSSVPLYGKMEILSFGEDRSVTFQVLANQNCGFKGLEPGFPDR
jgi:hypothetical protein